jgi:hypothetical protein
MLTPERLRQGADHREDSHGKTEHLSSGRQFRYAFGQSYFSDGGLHMETAVPSDVTNFLQNWSDDPNKARPAFETFLDFLASNADVRLSFKARPGISYSLRASHSKLKKRELFALVDVVDDDPENRWLSVCFYADMVTDPEGRCDEVPQGLDGEDARCFNLDSDDGDMRRYLLARLREAAKSAPSKG